MKKKFFGAVAMAATLALGLTACGSGSDAAATVENGDKKDLKVVVFNGWDEGVAASELWKAILTEEGYNVKLEYADAAPVYSGLSSGDYDVVLDTWLPITHKSYIEEYGDKMVDLGAWNSDAKLTIAVNADAPIDSLEDLAANADKFGNKIIGIEPGAGLTEVTTDDVIPGYGLDKMEYITSSTPAMLSELKTATSKGENIVVTLWRPHWAYDAFPVKDLKDPKGLLGEAEGIHSFSRLDFDKDFPTLDGWLKNFKMDSDTLHSLENVMFNGEKTDDYTEVVKNWIAENQDYVDSLTA
ncbi:glycine betaine/proline transport system substrate-binding protein [Arthrobacter stackebrandtii]|uniref:Glycine betaine/proline transport system substrate-binding protein n=1 Tax=Arthrobacter stackebrandtii TaxID=272161 RepID=A0ABS4YVX0_9MICC|nr:glycine betaine ABC transporter substrate-binding protein [Arthrobacter stackebrandtii]MBP2412958.1 glycine betaine/proline transport system substrate-binding protein [Arthrobacter stackebrandtii]PYH01250.1 glycine/betaine ABC transporter substrate-binding protein [Arthrobacter stackebrandtii]